MAYGVILKHLEVDKLGGSFSKKKEAPHFRLKEGRGALSLTGVENTAVSLSKPKVADKYPVFDILPA
jgi:hypothetical protein